MGEFPRRDTCQSAIGWFYQRPTIAHASGGQIAEVEIIATRHTRLTPSFFLALTFTFGHTSWEKFYNRRLSIVQSKFQRGTCASQLVLYRLYSYTTCRFLSGFFQGDRYYRCSVMPKDRSGYRFFRHWKYVA